MVLFQGRIFSLSVYVRLGSIVSRDLPCYECDENGRRETSCAISRRGESLHKVGERILAYGNGVDGLVVGECTACRSDLCYVFESDIFLL